MYNTVSIVTVFVDIIQIDDEPFNPEYTVADRVIDVANSTEPNGEVKI